MHFLHGIKPYHSLILPDLPPVYTYLHLPLYLPYTVQASLEESFTQMEDTQILDAVSL